MTIEIWVLDPDTDDETQLDTYEVDAVPRKGEAVYLPGHGWYAVDHIGHDVAANRRLVVVKRREP